MKPTFKYPLYAVTWSDAESDASWVDEPLVPLKPTLALTIGFLIRDEEHYILMADSYFLEPHSKIISNTTKIPKGMIVEMTPLNIVVPRKKKGPKKGPGVSVEEEARSLLVPL